MELEFSIHWATLCLAAGAFVLVSLDIFGKRRDRRAFSIAIALFAALLVVGAAHNIGLV